MKPGVFVVCRCSSYVCAVSDHLPVVSIVSILSVLAITLDINVRADGMKI